MRKVEKEWNTFYNKLNHRISQFFIYLLSELYNIKNINITLDKNVKFSYIGLATHKVCI